MHIQLTQVDPVVDEGAIDPRMPGNVAQYHRFNGVSRFAFTRRLKKVEKGTVALLVISCPLCGWRVCFALGEKGGGVFSTPCPSPIACIVVARLIVLI